MGLSFLEMSAKDNINIQESFFHMASEIKQKKSKWLNFNHKQQKRIKDNSITTKETQI